MLNILQPLELAGMTDDIPSVWLLIDSVVSRDIEHPGGHPSMLADDIHEIPLQPPFGDIIS
jgi:hypothetical protein